MAINGEKRVDGSFLKVGLAKCKVLAFNPTKEQLEKILDTRIEKDPEYEVEDDVYEPEDGEAITSKKCRLNIWLEEIATGNKFCLRMTLIDRVQQSKSGKVRFIDNKGNLSYYLDSVDNLVDFMKENSPWDARIGEYDLYRFLRAWQNKIDRRKVDDFTINWNDLVRGKVKEINSWIGSDFEGEIIVLLCVKVNLKKDEETGETEIQEYQEVYNRNFLPGDTMKSFTTRGDTKSKMVKEFIKEVTDPEYGVKNYFGGTLGEMREYIRAENPNATLDAFVEDDQEEPQTADYD